MLLGLRPEEKKEDSDEPINWFMYLGRNVNVESACVTRLREIEAELSIAGRESGVHQRSVHTD